MIRDTTTKVLKGDVRESGLEIEANKVGCMPPKGECKSEYLLNSVPL
jgi:hypothetical protein